MKCGHIANPGIEGGPRLQTGWS